MRGTAFACVVCGLLVIPIDVWGQTQVREDQTLRAEWNVVCDRVCTEPAGTAGWRVVVNDVAGDDLGNTPPIDIVVPLPGVGLHTVSLEAYNAGGVTRGPTVSFEVVPALPSPPPAPPAAILAVEP